LALIYLIYMLLRFLRCLNWCLLLGCRLGSLGMLEALCAFCVLRGALRFFDIYNITYQKKKIYAAENVLQVCNFML
jgi:hypothetical protein